MFGFGNRQKKEPYQESAHQEDYFYDEYGTDEYEEMDYDPSYEERYDHAPEEWNDGMEERSPRRKRGENTPYTEREPAEKNDHLYQEIARLEETVDQLKQQLEVKQAELSNMATKVTENEQTFHQHQKENTSRVQELEQNVLTLEQQLTKATEEKTRAVEEAIRKTKDMEEELATILVETRKQERATLERAEYEAKTIRDQAERDAQVLIHDASLELRVLKQEIKNYRKRLRAVQEENSQFFGRLLANSEALVDED
ncbi:hypothetical protein [Candidatus Enterococcus ferrettii]|uniref:Uncharacterized protein n=1 Tax=Candidatus Enterococcus ferrettii TaxID=2815324 RepID=A0ABV0EVK4_9ENTE|nr:hypothetical protein [Enterococcus sp. 665A]MBO1342874.1 hypothetical protein [Enterococcus sp. 665A]